METADNYNTTELVGLFNNLDGVVYSEAEYTPGDGNHITGTLIDDKTNLVFSRGWGDCPSGCIYREYWEFNVYDDCILKINWFSDRRKFRATENQAIVTNGGL